MEPPPRRVSKRIDTRIILQFDYDCFYAQVMENKHPHLKSKPLGVKQKNILATCNYNARARGVGKLMLISEAKRLCPDLVLMDGEDLTPFRDMSKILYNFLRSYSWSGKVERLGFDEVFMDITDIVDYNMSCLNRSTLADSFFYLSRKDPELGFSCDLTAVAGPTEGPLPDADGKMTDQQDIALLRLTLGSHLAMHLREKIETDFGYTSTCGIATNKVLSKLAGSRHKPRNQTTLLTFDEQQVLQFMDPHTLRKVPGVGFKMAHLIESHITGKEDDDDVDSHTFKSVVTVQAARTRPDISPAFLEKLLSGPGAERGVGLRIWNLLHGIDPSEVKEANDIPSQISIEDTYKGLETMAQITEELFKLSCSLVRRMRIDLVVPDTNADDAEAKRWIARPRTLRLAIRSWPKPGSEQSRSFSRVSRSGALPSFVFDLPPDIEELAEKLVAEALLPLLKRLNGEKGSGWNLQLINICVANMAAGAADDKHGAGRDIANMFKKQDEVLAPWKVTEGPEPTKDGKQGLSDEEGEDEEFDSLEGAAPWAGNSSELCDICGASIPSFAAPAHLRYHEMGE